MKLEDGEIHEIDREDPIILYDAEKDEDKSRGLTAQELINTLEDGIAKMEKYKGEKLIQQLKQTLIFICKILAVELDKLILENLSDSSYVT